MPRGAGRLLVSATSGWCQLAVDGKILGPTPVAGIDLPSGAHALRCEAPGGRVKTATVTIQEGATSRIKLALASNDQRSGSRDMSQLWRRAPHWRAATR